jgi:hypothetical protein
MKSQSIISIAAILGALASFFGVAFSVNRYFVAEESYEMFLMSEPADLESFISHLETALKNNEHKDLIIRSVSNISETSDKLYEGLMFILEAERKSAIKRSFAWGFVLIVFLLVLWHAGQKRL